MTGPHLFIAAMTLLLSLPGLLWLYHISRRPLPAPATARLQEAAQQAEPQFKSSDICHPAGEIVPANLDPVLAVKQACLAMEGVAKRTEVDLLRPYHVPVVSLQVERGPLVTLLKSILQNALEATPKRGAVICNIKLTEKRVHFVISDSSGCAEDGAVLLSEMNWRLESLSPSKLIAQALGGHLNVIDYPGEGVVVDLSFARPNADELRLAETRTSWGTQAENDDRSGVEPDPNDAQPNQGRYRL